MIKQLRATGAFAERKNQLIELTSEAGGQWGVVIEALDGEDSIHLNDAEPFHAASVIKIPIMMTAFHEAREGRTVRRYCHPEKPGQSRWLRCPEGAPFRTGDNPA